jgi:hypothetical protein
MDYCHLRQADEVSDIIRSHESDEPHSLIKSRLLLFAIGSFSADGPEHPDAKKWVESGDIGLEDFKSSVL